MKNFATWIVCNRGFVEWTAENYCRSLKLFDEYLRKISFWKRSIKKPESITLKDVNMFVKLERTKWKSATTCNNYLAWIKAYMKYNDVIWKNVFDYRRILTIREHQKKIEALNDDEAKRLIDYLVEEKILKR